IRVLHVDDEPDIRAVVDLSLTLDPEFEVKSCASGAEALVAAVEWLPHVILLDVMMPDMDGATTLAKLRQNPSTAHIPVLLMTARALADDMQRFRLLGVLAVISKPFDPLALPSLVRGHLAATQEVH